MTNKNQDVHYLSGTDEWATPPKLFARLDKHFNFTLDPCATDENALCDTYYTIEDDGLSKEWAPHTVYVNPPFGNEIKKWVQKSYEESQKGATVVMLIPARTDTKYWHEWIFHKASNIIFIAGRLKYGEGKNHAPFPSAVIIFDGEPGFIETMDRYGEDERS